MCWLVLVGIQRDKSQRCPRRPVSELAVVWNIWMPFACGWESTRGDGPEFCMWAMRQRRERRDIPVRATLISAVAYLAVGADRRLRGGRGGSVCSVESASRSRRKSLFNRRCSEKVMNHSNVQLLQLKPKHGRGFFIFFLYHGGNGRSILPLISHWH